MSDKRNRCPACGTVAWDPDLPRFMRDHDRPDGRRCLVYRKLLAETAKLPDFTTPAPSGADTKET